jgi:ornithine cyclodeaminase/alanine dehydrogenase-like protein (mu-crystallin family)
MIRFLTEEDVAATLDVATTIDLLDSAARALEAGTASVTPRQRPATTGVFMNLMGAGLDGRIGHKCYPIARPHGANFVVTLYGSDAKMLALIQANKLGQIRTGAASGLATRLMARADASRAAIIGTGWQARTQLEAVCKARPIKHAFAAGRNPEHTQKFCTEMTASLGIPVEPAADVASAVRDADVVSVMTSASEPLLFGSMLKPGTHVNAAGSNRATSTEIDAEVVSRSGIVAIELLAQAKVESGDLLSAEKAGAWDWSRATLLSDIVAGKKPGRTSDDQITLFESLGIALWDIAAANYVFDQCVKTGRGKEIDLPI